MDPFSTAVAIIAVIQIADRVIELCKFYLEAARDAPSDLRHIFVETAALKAILDSLHFLHITSTQELVTHSLVHLYGDDGPVEACRKTLTELCGLFPNDVPGATAASQASSKAARANLKSIMAALAWPLREGKARKLLSELVQHKTTINLALTVDSSRDIKSIKAKVDHIHQTISESDRERVYAWIRSTDPSNRHHQACKLYEQGTGDWVFRSPEWKSWIEGRSRCVWIHGIPGAGKTILTSHIVETVKDICKTEGKTACIYYYCYFGNFQDEAAPFLKWVVERLCRQADVVPDCLYRLFRNAAEPSLVDLLHALEAILQEFQTVYVVVDALDESKPRDDLLRVVRDLSTDVRFAKVRILTTSREYIDIENVMSQFSARISMRNEWLDADIRLFIEAQLSANQRLRRWPAELQRAALERLSEKAKGMFRWVVCQIDVLARLTPKEEAVERALAALPETLDETYERMFLQIPSGARRIVHETMKWTYSHNEIHENNVPSRILLQIVRKSVASSSSASQDYNYDIELLREFCGCLLTIGNETRTPSYIPHREEECWTAETVTFAHYTVWEFLTSARLKNGPAAYFAVDSEEVVVDYAKLVFLGALSAMKTDITPIPKNCPTHERRMNDMKHTRHVEQNFSDYCLTSAALCLRKLYEGEIELDELKSYVIQLADASKPHFPLLTRVATTLDLIDDGFDWQWHIYLENPTLSTGLRTFLALFCMVKSTELIRAFLTTQSQSFLDTVLREQIVVRDTSHEPRFQWFTGTVVELLARNDFMDSESLTSLFELVSGHFDPSAVLVVAAGTHFHSGGRGSTACGDCPLARLLQLGADTRGGGYRLRPLQIAAARKDFVTFEMLLRARANPDDCGTHGVVWRDDSEHGAAYNPLIRKSPREIVRLWEDSEDHSDFDIIVDLCLGVEDTGAEGDNLEKIKRLLVEYDTSRPKLKRPRRK
ncbi:hypothetical protein QBC34DRAFT_356380, partial [Podospora aff. communis PSN243]